MQIHKHFTLRFSLKLPYQHIWGSVATMQNVIQYMHMMNTLCDFKTDNGVDMLDHIHHGHSIYYCHSCDFKSRNRDEIAVIAILIYLMSSLK